MKKIIRTDDYDFIDTGNFCRVGSVRGILPNRSISVLDNK